MKDKIGPACNQLQDFIDETNAEVLDGAFSAGDGEGLISAAEAIQSELEC